MSIQLSQLLLMIHGTTEELRKAETTNKESDSNYKLDQMLLKVISIARIAHMNSAYKTFLSPKQQLKLPRCSPFLFRKNATTPNHQWQASDNPIYIHLGPGKEKRRPQNFLNRSRTRGVQHNLKLLQ